MYRYIRRDKEDQRSTAPHVASNDEEDVEQSSMSKQNHQATGSQAATRVLKDALLSHAVNVDWSRRHESSLRSQEEDGDRSLLPPSTSTLHVRKEMSEVSEPLPEKQVLEKMAPTPASKEAYSHPGHRTRAPMSSSDGYYYSIYERSKSTRSMASSTGASFDDTAEQSAMTPLDVDHAVAKACMQEAMSIISQDSKEQKKEQAHQRPNRIDVAEVLPPPAFQRQERHYRTSSRPGATRINPNGVVIDMIERQSSQMTMETNGTNNDTGALGNRQPTLSTLDSDNDFLVNAELVSQGEEGRHKQSSESTLPITRASVIGKDENFICGIDKWKILLGLGMLLLLATVGAIVATVMVIVKPDDASEAPSFSPSTTEEKDVFDLLTLALPQSSMTKIRTDPASGQAQAFDWLMQDLSDHPQLYDQEFRAFQRYALATLFYATDGPNRWANADVFLRGTDECTWLDYIYGGWYPFCDDEGHVVDMNLYQNNLKGTIPPDLMVLTRLQNLSLFYNSLTGTIPTEIFSLPQLTGLGIDRNSLSGTIPTEVGLLTTLVYFDVDENGGLVGTIPTELGLLTSLTRLWLEYNRLTGTLPTELGLLTEVTGLFVSENQLDATFPTELGAISKLRKLDIEGSGIHGSIPSELGQCTDLELLLLSGNDLTGTLPLELFPPQGGCQLLNVRAERNMLSGTIPTGLASCDMMTSLTLAENSFEGIIPTQIGQLVNLFDLRLNNNKFAGPLPSELGELANVGRFHLHENALTGTVPSQFGMLQNVSQLWAQGNDITGSLPTEVCLLLELSDDDNIIAADDDETNSTTDDDQEVDDSPPDLQFDCGPRLDCSCLGLWNV